MLETHTPIVYVYFFMQVVAEGECFMDCGESLVCTIRDILYQADYGGDCYETVSGRCLASLIYSLSMLIGFCLPWENWDFSIK